MNPSHQKPLSFERSEHQTFSQVHARQHTVSRRIALDFTSFPPFWAGMKGLTLSERIIVLFISKYSSALVMKTAITVTIDMQCAQYLDGKVGKKSHYINKLILSDMQDALEEQKSNWIMCKKCDVPYIDEDGCVWCERWCLIRFNLMILRDAWTAELSFKKPKTTMDMISVQHADLFIPWIDWLKFWRWLDEMYLCRLWYWVRTRVIDDD